MSKKKFKETHGFTDRELMAFLPKKPSLLKEMLSVFSTLVVLAAVGYLLLEIVVLAHGQK